MKKLAALQQHTEACSNAAAGADLNQKCAARSDSALLETTAAAKVQPRPRREPPAGQPWHQHPARCHRTATAQRPVTAALDLIVQVETAQLLVSFRAAEAPRITIRRSSFADLTKACVECLVGGVIADEDGG
jgi:hypothetical protein